jgi:Na+/melibiose symporter-like transporter
MEQFTNSQESKGFYKLSWLQRIGFGAGDLAQNLIYQTICMYLLFFYTDVYVLGGDAATSAGLAGTMFLVVRIVDVLWDPLVGTFVDKHNPSLGKYRSYLVMGGIPLTILAILCFWDGFKPSIVYAYITYVGMSMLYTLINVPYGALNSSLTRDTNEITILTSVRMFMANVGGLCVSAGVPIIVALFASSDSLPIEMALFMGLGSLPSFIFMPLVPAIKRKVGKKNMFYIFLTVAIIGMMMLYVISKMGTVKENIILVYVAQFIKSTGVIVATGYMWALIPEVISYGEYTTGRRISGIVNALTGIFFKAGMALGGVIPGWVLAWTHYQAAEEAQTLPKDSNAWFLTMLIFALVGLALLIFCFSQTKERVVMDESETKNVKVSDLWTEFLRNKPLRIIALFFITAFAMMSVGNAAGAYFMNDLELQEPMAQEGIRWLVCIIPAILLVVAMFIISKYELSDEVIDDINKKIEERSKDNK